jgi:hypothetical protein
MNFLEIKSCVQSSPDRSVANFERWIVECKGQVRVRLQNLKTPTKALRYKLVVDVK